MFDQMEGKLSALNSRHDGRCQHYENIAILNPKNLHFFVPTGPPLKIRQNERRGKIRCVLKLTYLSVNHTKSFKKIGDAVQNWLRDLRVLPQILKFPMNFFETFHECSLPSTVSKKKNNKKDRSPFSLKRCDGPILPHLCLFSC